jgi:hypothetical protein
MAKKKTGVGKFLAKIWGFIAKIFKAADEGTKRLLPIVTGIVNRIKEIDDTHIGDIITMIIPGDADDKLVAKFREILPKVILALGNIKEISDTEDVNEKLKKILVAINVSPEDTKKVFYTGLATLILEKVSDGELSWGDSLVILKYYYDNFPKQ